MIKNVALLLLLTLAGVACANTPPPPASVADGAALTPAAAADDGPAEDLGNVEIPSLTPTWRPFLQTPTPAGVLSRTVTPTPTSPPVAPDSPTAASPTAPGCDPAPPDWQPHLVQFGETIGRLAQCVGATAAEIVAINCLPGNGNLIYPGQRLYLPGICAPPITLTPASRDGTPPVDLTVTPTPTRPLAPPPSGSMTVQPAVVTPGNWVWLIFEGFSPNTNLPVSITAQSTSFEPIKVCIDTNGIGRHAFWVPADFPLGRVQIIAKYEVSSSTGRYIIEPCLPGQPAGAGNQGAVGGFNVVEPAATPQTAATTSGPTPTATSGEPTPTETATPDNEPVPTEPGETVSPVPSPTPTTIPPSPQATVGTVEPEASPPSPSAWQP